MPAPQTMAGIEQYVTFNTYQYAVGNTPTQGGFLNGPNQPGLATPAIGSDDLFS